MGLRWDTVDVVKLKASDRVGKQNKKRWVETIERATIKFQINTSDLTVPSNIFWCGHVFFSKDALRNSELTINDKVSREIVWELFNNNFALELLVTDQVHFPCHNLSEDEGMDRDAQVAVCFPEGILIGMDYPMLNRGLGVAHWQDRYEYVEAFHLLLSTWGEGIAMTLKEMLPLMCTSSEREVEDVERVTYPFYCQKFFDFFGHAPCVPLCVPHP